MGVELNNRTTRTQAKPKLPLPPDWKLPDATGAANPTLSTLKISD